MIRDALERVSADRIRHDLFHLCRDPLPFRKVNYTRPGQSACSLDEADAYISGQLKSAGYDVTTTRHKVQAFRCDKTKTPKNQWFSSPLAGDPWYEASNLEAAKLGRAHPEEIIQLISHKDSMSWIESPGAHDNGTGTVANLEMMRVLATCDLKRSVRVLFCNEEHWPWTSRAAADAAALRGESLFRNPEVGCAVCHEPPSFADLHAYDVGTQTAYDKEARAFDTPTLRELWRTPPYLHDGSAATLRDVVTARNPKDEHGKTSHLTPQQIDDLVQYLLAL